MVVGVTHECDYPPEAVTLPRVTRCALELDGLSPSEIDRKVSEALRQGRDIYELDRDLIYSLKPDVVITQKLCDVCAVSSNIARSISEELKDVELVELNPRSLGGILDSILTVGKAVGLSDSAMKLCAEMRSRIATVQKITSQLTLKKVFFMEWIEPIYCSGHWIPDMMRVAGCYDPVARPHEDSVRIQPQKVAEQKPEIIFAGACGLSTAQIAKQFEDANLMELQETPAFQNGMIFAVDANSYFTRPGPRVADGIELLAYLAHGSPFSWHGRGGAFARIVHAGAELV